MTWIDASRRADRGRSPQALVERLRERAGLSPQAFARIALVALALNCTIVLSGAAVRITGSGLGCPTWPTCKGGSFFGQWEYHYAIEWSNRVFTLAITAWTIITLASALLRKPYRRDLSLLALALLGGIGCQIVLGGLTVLFELAPLFVVAHFLLSMAMLVIALTLWNRSRISVPNRLVNARSGRLMRLNLALTGVVVFLGTLTTAAGPHSGDAAVTRRLGQLDSAVGLHSAAVVSLLIVAVMTRVVLAKTGTSPSVERLSSWQLAILGAQGALGVTQYRLGLPGYLVELHVAGALALWATTVQLFLATRPGAGATGVAAPETWHNASYLPDPAKGA